MTNLSFADNVVLVATSKSDVARMIAGLDWEAGEFGLKMLAGKNKIMTNNKTSIQYPVP